jgi:hypothetical protein
MASVDAFLRKFVESAKRDWRLDGPAFTLVLGAGASRSAGVPLAGKMVEVLERIASLAGVTIPKRTSAESSLSWTFRHVVHQIPWEDEFFDYAREFIMSCITRADREPNVTHLLAAHFAGAHLVGDIVTTNFDDLAPAAFWSQPISSAYHEPYVVYRPEADSNPRAAAGVPVIVKAHGHHNQYGLDIIDRDIKRAAPFVKKIIQSRPKPEVGYIVVGYSGAWADGVMATLSDKKAMRGKTVYWFFVGHPPCGEHVNAMREAGDVRFIGIADSDALFLRMWNELHADEEYLNPPMFEPYHLFNMAGYGARRHATREELEKWWDTPTLTETTTRALRNFPRIAELRRELVPLLRALDKWDNDCLLWDCAPASLRARIRKSGGAESWKEPPEARVLRERIPVDIQWTRRNRKLLRMALGNHVDPMMPFTLLYGLKATQS